jgi:WD40 repeat protein
MYACHVLSSFGQCRGGILLPGFRRSATWSALAVALLSLLVQIAGGQIDAENDNKAHARPLWTAPGYVTAWSLAGDESPPAAIAPDGKTVVVCRGTRADIFDARTGAFVLRLGRHPFKTFSATWSPDGALLAVTMQGDTLGASRWLGELNRTWRAQSQVYLWRVKDGALCARCVGHRAQVIGATFSPDNTRLLTFGIDDTMRLWDVATGEEIAVFETRVGGYPTRFAARLGRFSADPMRLITSGDRLVNIRNASNGLVEWPLLTAPTGRYCASIAVSPQAKIIACSREPYSAIAGSYEGTLRAARDARGAEHRAGREKERPAVAMNSLLLVVLKKDDGIVLPEGGPLGWKIIEGTHDYLSAIFSPDGTRLCAPRRDSKNHFELTIWDTATWQLLRTRAYDLPLRGKCVFTPDSRYLAVGPESYWDLKSGEWKQPGQRMMPEPLNTVPYEFSQDGTLLLTLHNDDGDGEVSVWDFKALEKTFTVQPAPTANR